MRFSSKLERGKFLKREKRFFAHIDWNGRHVVAHTPNTGSMKGCSDPGSECLFSVSDNPKRKLPYTLEMIKSGRSWVGVNTATPNKIVEEAVALRLFPQWKEMKTFKREAKISAETRFDFLLEMKGGAKHYLEVKNVTLARNKKALFPDSETTRGQKHLRELMRMVEEGHRGEVLFAVQRDDVSHFAPAEEIDPEYARLLREAHRAGVLVTAALVKLSPEEIVLTDRLLTLDL